MKETNSNYSETFEKVRKLCADKKYEEALTALKPHIDSNDCLPEHKDLFANLIVEILNERIDSISEEDVMRLLYLYVQVFTFQPSITHTNLMEFATNYETHFAEDYWFVQFCSTGVINYLDDADYSSGYLWEPSLAERIAKKLYKEMVHIHDEDNSKALLPFIEKAAVKCPDNKNLELYMMQFQFWAGNSGSANTIAETIIRNAMIMSTTKISKVSPDFYSFNDIPETPFHHPEMPKALKAKYWVVKKNLEQNHLTINSIVCNQYCDCYYVNKDNRLYRIDCYYNQAGAVTRYNIHDKSESGCQILQIIKDSEPALLSSYSYNPDSAALNLLDELITQKCKDIGIHIGNVDYRKNEHFVKYYLKTKYNFAVLQLYFTDKGEISKVHPFSSLGNDDEILKHLINDVFVYNRPSLFGFLDDAKSL